MNYVKENIRNIRKRMNLTQGDFGKLIGATRGMIAAYEGDDGKPKSEVVENIIRLFGISRKQLFEEKIDVGKLTINKDLKMRSVNIVEPQILQGAIIYDRDHLPKPVPESDFMEVPVLSIYSQAGYLRGGADIDSEKRFDIMLVPREYEKGHYLVSEIQGDSMDDGSKRSLIEGDKFLVKELDKSHWVNKLNLNKIWVIVHKEGVAFKEITEHDVKNGIICCHSWNPIFNDYYLNLQDVYRLFYVKKLVERRVKP